MAPPDSESGAPTIAQNGLVRVKHLHKSFRRQDGSVIKPINDISLDVEAGEMVVLLGPSGCGKTTLLRCIAGLERPDSGEVWINDLKVFDGASKTFTRPESRAVSMVFQSYALWPHMTVFRNVAYPLQVRGYRKAEIEARVAAVLDVVGIADLRKQYPAQLSGGQQQRVSLARAIVPENKVVLFDEPLSNVDAQVRQQLRQEIYSMQRELGFAAIYVTHDQEEAMELADRMVVLDAGVIAQAGSPLELYRRPRSRYVANFLGTANNVEGTIVSIEDGVAKVAVPFGTLAARALPPHTSGDPVLAIWRAESTQLVPRGSVESNSWPGVVVQAVTNGPLQKYKVDVDGVHIDSWSAGGDILAPGSAVVVSIRPGDVQLVPR